MSAEEGSPYAVRPVFKNSAVSPQASVLLDASGDRGSSLGPKKNNVACTQNLQWVLGYPSFLIGGVEFLPASKEEPQERAEDKKGGTAPQCEHV